MNAFVACNEMRGSLVCPKPRRIVQVSAVADPIWLHRWHASHQMDPCELIAGVELLDILVTTENMSNTLDSSPPFFCGSPPSRSANPIVHDAQFGEVNPNSTPLCFPAPISVSASANKGYTRMKFGFSPAAVRVEGFDCLDRDRSRSHGISAFA